MVRWAKGKQNVREGRELTGENMRRARGAKHEAWKEGEFGKRGAWPSNSADDVTSRTKSTIR